MCIQDIRNMMMGMPQLGFKEETSILRGIAQLSNKKE